MRTTPAYILGQIAKSRLETSDAIAAREHWPVRQMENCTQ